MISLPLYNRLEVSDSNLAKCREVECVWILMEYLLPLSTFQLLLSE